jgi:glutathione S-transferase
MRARLALTISKTPVQLREVVLRDKPDAMLTASPKGTVPVLVTENNVLEQSLHIMQWALRKNDPEDWLASIDDPLIAQNDGPFKHHLDHYKYAARYENSDPAKHQQKGFEHLQALENRLSGAAYLAGQSRGFVDMALFPFVRQFRNVNPDTFDAAPIPGVQGWLTGLTGSALFGAIMGKYPPWKTTGEAFEFPSTNAKAR